MPLFKKKRYNNIKDGFPILGLPDLPPSIGDFVIDDNLAIGLFTTVRIIIYTSF